IQTYLFWRNDIFTHFGALANLADTRGRDQRTFIKAILAMNDQRVLAAQAKQDLTHFAQERRVGHTKYLVACASGIGQRTENIKDRADANLASGWSYILHCRVVSLGKHKAKTSLLDTPCYLLRFEIDTCSQGFQDIGTATAAGSRAIAMFGN